MRNTALWMLVGLALAAVGLGLVLADNHGDTGDVRVNARRLDDGRVEVALQQRTGAGWEARQLPERRFLPVDAPTGVWRSSSDVALSTIDDDAQEMFCLVTHARPGDETFWEFRFAGTAHRWDVYHEGVDVVVKHGATPELQAQMIEECLTEGAAAIGSTLAAPEVISDVLSEVREQGIVVVTFNSGLEDYRAARSARHISIDERLSGTVVAQELVSRGVEGPLLCVIHELRNVGLDQRCGGLEAAYGNGEVVRVRVSGVDDLGTTSAELRMRVSERDDWGAIVTLNSEVGIAALEVVDALGRSHPLATYDQNREVLEAIRDGRMLFAVDTLPSYQAWYALSSMLFLVRTEPRVRQLYGIEDPSVILSQVPILLGPRLFTQENARDWLQAVYGTDRAAVTTEIDPDGESN
ncbi:MAG: substrate-binding domain-containing protein [Chloroflexota bacterium]|nr:substrate-binding domain-containing protein [Chloroflexota bacterium]